MLRHMERCNADHASLRHSTNGVEGRTFRDLVDDETPHREDIYRLVHVTCACGAVFTHARLVASREVTAAYIAAQHAEAAA